MRSDGTTDIWATAIENWPEALRAQIEPLDEVPLTQNDLMAIGQYTPGFLECFDVDPGKRLEIDSETNELIDGQFQDSLSANFFVRLGICSFKTEGPVTPVGSRNDLLRQILRPNPRLARLLRLMLEENQPATLFFRPWLPFLSWGNFRVLVIDGQVLGVSQANTEQIYPEIAQNEQAIRLAIQALLKVIWGNLHMPSVVLELGLLQTDHGFEARLIELNPAIQRTDIGLFDWKDVKVLDGHFKFHRTIGR